MRVETNVSSSVLLDTGVGEVYTPAIPKKCYICQKDQLVFILKVLKVKHYVQMMNHKVLLVEI